MKPFALRLLQAIAAWDRDGKPPCGRDLKFAVNPLPPEPTFWQQALHRPSYGAVYTELDRLEEAGFVRSELGTERPPERLGQPRRFYWLTQAGREALGTEKAA